MARTRPDLSKYTPAQVQAARMLCDVGKKYTKKEVAAAVGVTDRTLYRWTDDEDFIDLVGYFNEKIMDMFAVELYQALRDQVKRGNVKAIELGMKRMGVLIDRKEIQSDVNVQHELIAGKSNDELRAEIAAREKSLLGDVIDTTETTPGVFDAVITPDAIGDAGVDIGGDAD